MLFSFHAKNLLGIQHLEQGPTPLTSCGQTPNLTVELWGNHIFKNEGKAEILLLERILLYIT